MWLGKLPQIRECWWGIFRSQALKIRLINGLAPFCEKSYADQIRKYVPHHYTVLGTNGFGRSDSRAQLRHFFEVDRYFITVAALHSLAETKQIKASVVTDAIKKFNLDPEKVNPGTH